MGRTGRFVMPSVQELDGAQHEGAGLRPVHGHAPQLLEGLQVQGHFGRLGHADQFARQLATRVETKLDHIAQGLTDLGSDVADHEARLRVLEAMPKSSDIEPRVTALERGRWPLRTIGVLAGAAGAATGAIALFAR